MISDSDYTHAVREYTKNIFRFLFKSLKDEEAVNDIVQDCYLKLWISRQNVDTLKIKAWLFSTAHNGMINYTKVLTRKVKLDKWVKEPHVYQKHDFDTKEILDKALNELPAIQKSIILLRDLEGYNYQEIGEILGLNESQVKVYLFRARQKLRDSIKSLINVL